MLVSVIVPTYNRVGLIGRAIESIVNQTYRDIEIVVVDDGSTDNTEEVIADISASAPRPIKYFKKPNGGCASARNKGTQLAAGDLIAFLDSDDLWMSDALESMVSALIKGGADFVYSPAYEAYPDRTEINYPSAAGRPDNFAVEHFMETNARNGALLFRKEVFAKVGMLDEGLRHNEDSDFVQRAAIRCKAAYCNIPTVKVCYHDTNKSANRVALLKAVLKSTEKILGENPEFARSLEDRAATRIARIKAALVEALILSNDFEEAGAIAGRIKEHLGVSARIALLSRSGIPIKAKNFSGIMKNIILYHAGKILGKKEMNGLQAILVSLMSADDETNVITWAGMFCSI